MVVAVDRKGMEIVTQGQISDGELIDPEPRHLAII